jgi:hypothetical protein
MVTVGVLLAALAAVADALTAAVVIAGATLPLLVAAPLPLLPLWLRLRLLLLTAEAEPSTLAVRLADQLAATLRRGIACDADAETLATVAVTALEAHLGNADPDPKEANTIVSALLRAVRVVVAHARAGVGHTGASKNALTGELSGWELSRADAALELGTIRGGLANSGAGNRYAAAKTLIADAFQTALFTVSSRFASPEASLCLTPLGGLVTETAGRVLAIAVLRTDPAAGNGHTTVIAVVTDAVRNARAILVRLAEPPTNRRGTTCAFSRSSTSWSVRATDRTPGILRNTVCVRIAVAETSTEPRVGNRPGAELQANAGFSLHGDVGVSAATSFPALLRHGVARPAGRGAGSQDTSDKRDKPLTIESYADKPREIVKALAIHLDLHLPRAA